MDANIDTIREAISQPEVTAAALISLGSVAVAYTAWTLLRIVQIYWLKRTWIEITPPVAVKSSSNASLQLFNVIHGQNVSRSIQDKLLRIPSIFSLEITSSKSGGIQYLAFIPERNKEEFQKHITSYISGARCKAINRQRESMTSITDFKLSNHFMYPLADFRTSDVDPLNYILGSMTKQLPNEFVTYQLIIEPTKVRGTTALSRQIRRNDDVLVRPNTGVLSLAGTSLTGISNLIGGIASVIGEIINGSLNGHRLTYSSNRQMTAPIPQAARSDRPSRVISSFEQELLASINDKISQPLYKVSLRVMVSGQQPATIRALKSALDGFSTPLYQSLRAKRSIPIANGYRKYLVQHRYPSRVMRTPMLLSSSELASLYHFMDRASIGADNLQTSLARTLPAPVSLKKGIIPDVVLGINDHKGVETQIGLTEQERARHVYVIGGTGNGKTTLLQYQIVQDIHNDKGVAVIDPHGDMAEFILTQIPKRRVKDVIYINPSDFDYPIGLNLLEYNPSLTGNELLHEKDLITESVISVFRKIFSEEDTGGHRIEYVLRNAVQTALTVEGSTLFTVFDLLNDAKFRKQITSKLTDKHLKNFWNQELSKAGDMQRVKMGAGITSKIGRFLFSASARHVLGQAKSTIDFDDILNTGQILICNLSKGNIGEDTSELFGITILAKIQLASLKRAKLPIEERTPYYLYVDEFQNFATPSFVQMLSESRKYKLALVMAEQSTSQQSDRQMVDIILANVGTIVVFKTGNPQDEKVLFPLFRPYIDEGEISNLPSYSFYAKLSATTSQEPLSGHTLLIDNAGNQEIRDLVIEHSRKTYASKLEEPLKDKAESTAIAKRQKASPRKVLGEPSR